MVKHIAATYLNIMVTVNSSKTGHLNPLIMVIDPLLSILNRNLKKSSSLLLCMMSPSRRTIWAKFGDFILCEKSK